MDNTGICLGDDQLETKVSCIVPIYNLELKVDKCIKSLLNQSLDSVEIILVDDCSTDNTREYLKKYEQFENIKIIHSPENRHQGGARNLGLEASSGEFISFIDGDDWVESTMLADLYNYAKKHNCDIVDSDYYQDDETGRTEKRVSIPESIISSNSVKDLMINSGRIWTKIIHRSLLMDNKIRFVEHKKFEDNPYLPLLIPYAKKIGKVNQNYYHYIYNTESSSRKLDDLSVFDRLCTANWMMSESKKRGLFNKYKEEYEILYIKLFYCNTVTACITKFSKVPYKYIKIAYLDISKRMPEFRKNSYIKSSEKYVKVITKLNLVELYLFAAILSPLMKKKFKKLIIKQGKNK